MRKGRLQVTSTIPGARNLGPLVKRFCAAEGVVTAFSDSSLRSLSAFIGDGDAVEAIPFGALARRFAILSGEMPRQIARRSLVVAAIAAACEELPDESPFARTARMPGLHKALAETLHELAEFGIGADEYDSLAARAPSPLSDKLRSLFEIERSAEDGLARLGRSLGRDLLADTLDSAPEAGADLGRILVIAGGKFNPQACRLLVWASEHGAEVEVVVYRHASTGSLFRPAKQTIAALGAKPKQFGVSTTLLEHLFAPTQASNGHPAAEIVSAADPLAEAEWMLRRCLAAHADGMPYERMAMFARESAGYAPLVEAAAKRLGVPIRMWRRAPLLTNSFARLTLGALRFCAGSDVRSLRAIAETTYFNLDSDSRTRIRDALSSAHADRRDPWTALSDWTSANPDFAWLDRLLEWRRAAIVEAAPMDGWIERLRELIAVLPLDEGSVVGRERDQRAQYVLHQSLNVIASMVRVRSPRSLTLREFAKRAESIWKEADVSVPAGTQGVLVTGNSDALPDVEMLIVLGMLEGVFPRRRSEEPVLSDQDREWISDAVGGVRLPDSRTKAEAERDEFYSVCAAPSRTLVLSYPETGEDQDNVPAFYLEEVGRATPVVPRTTHPRDLLTPSAEDCHAAADRDLCAAIGDPERGLPPASEFQAADTVERFSRPDPGAHSPRELREVHLCPFAYFARRTLKLDPGRLRAHWASLAGLPRASGLASAHDAETARADLERMLEEKLDSLYGSAPAWEIALLRAGASRLIPEWLDREFEARRIWPRTDVQSDVKFGTGGLQDSLPRGVTLAGRVPAVSRIGPYRVVHLDEASLPQKERGELDLPDEDVLYHGLHLLAAWSRESPSALEVESMSGARLLVVAQRVASANLHASVGSGLKLLDLAGSDDSHGVKALFDRVKSLAADAVNRIRTADVRAIKGDHCAWCDYGELCRQSKEFDEEGSPFA